GLVSEQINDILSKMGIKPIRTVGEEFDPHYHEAVATDESGEYPQNTITGEILRGYIVGDRVIRHSMVKVAMGAAKPAEDSLPTPKPAETLDPDLV
ncbi:MAG: nucleotide exchange factor GrpE, partial [bacterium]|nr:nucleotide exchange factor GrpE [bacterium]